MYCSSLVKLDFNEQWCKLKGFVLHINIMTSLRYYNKLLHRMKGEYMCDQALKEYCNKADSRVWWNSQQIVWFRMQTIRSDWPELTKRPSGLVLSIAEYSLQNPFWVSLQPAGHGSRHIRQVIYCSQTLVCRGLQTQDAIYSVTQLLNIEDPNVQCSVPGECFCF